MGDTWCDSSLGNFTVAPSCVQVSFLIFSSGTVLFERPALKESREQLLLQIAEAEEVDHPVLVPIAFVAPGKGAAK
jgi:hypothetical protein